MRKGKWPARKVVRWDDRQPDEEELEILTDDELDAAIAQRLAEGRDTGLHVERIYDLNACHNRVAQLEHIAAIHKTWEGPYCGNCHFANILCADNCTVVKQACYIKRGVVVLDVHYEYPTRISKRSSPADILHWIDHLSGKGWMHKDILQRFIRLSAKHIGGVPGVFTDLD